MKTKDADEDEDEKRDWNVKRKASGGAYVPGASRDVIPIRSLNTDFNNKRMSLIEY